MPEVKMSKEALTPQKLKEEMLWIRDYVKGRYLNKEEWGPDAPVLLNVMEVGEETAEMIRKKLPFVWGIMSTPVAKSEQWRIIPLEFADEIAEYIDSLPL